LFFALWPDPEAQNALAHATQKAIAAAKGRPVRTENLHITLAFLGSVPEADLEKVEAIATDIAAETGRVTVEITLNSIEYWKKSQLLCATAQAAPRGALPVVANAWSKALKLRLVTAGFAPDLKPFQPHVTLARKVWHATHTRALQPVVWNFTGFALIESRTHADGAVYTVLRTFCPGIRS
jgi:2'-5' RNA ligase